MRIVASTICALTLAGCASNLPYTIAIDDPPPTIGDLPHETNKRPDYKKCVLRLDDIVKAVADNYSRSESDNVKSLQVKFEMQLRHGTQTEFGTQHNKEQMAKEREKVAQPLEEPPLLEGCEKLRQEMNKDDSSFVKFFKERADSPLIEEVAKKWLTSYALDATDPDQSLDRFREYVRSAQLVENLAERPIKPEESEDNWTQLAIQPQSQWCGTALPKGSSCDEKRSLYHVQSVLKASPNPGETAKDLYKHLLSDIVQVERAGTQRNQRYFMLGYEIPWDKERTLVRYGVTFYFRQTETEPDLVKLIGYDLTYANEATPAPDTKKISESLPWLNLNNAWRSTGYPFSLVIGLKNAAFEIAKVPFSTIAGLLIGRDAYNYPAENVLAARDALYVEAFRLPQSPWGSELSSVWGLYRLLTEIPLVGQLFQYNLGSDHSEKDVLSDITRRKIFLSRGIYGGNKWGQDTGLWTLFARQSYPTYDVYSPSYGHGTAIDVLWSMFNLSHGPAYNEARYVMDYATHDDRLYLAGHSGGVQRSVAASRILSNFGYKVIKVVGIAGPSIGQAVVDTRYPEAFKEYLNTGAGANQDITSKIGNVAGAFTTLLDYSVIVPLKYTIGGLGGLFGKRDSIYRFADRLGFSNASIVEVERKPSSRHQTPMRLSFTDRLVFDAYIRNEFSTAFREDLERADSPHKTDRPHAFPWEQ